MLSIALRCFGRPNVWHLYALVQHDRAQSNLWELVNILRGEERLGASERIT